MTSKNELKRDKLVSVRMPLSLLVQVEAFARALPYPISRSAAIVYLIERGLLSESTRKEE